MKRTRNLALAIIMGAALTLTACGSDSKDSGGGKGAAKGKIGVILPDTKSSVRWESADKPALEAAFKKAGVSYSVQNAEGDADKMATIADGMIADGVTVLAIVNLDSDSGAAIEAKAAKQGVKTIDYDRLTLGGSADVYISYDNSKVGALQGEGLQKCLGADKQANLIFLNGSPTDNNATLFSKGAHSVLDKNKNYTKVGEQAVPDWDNDKAVVIFEQLYTKVDGKVDGVYAANDGLAGSVISRLPKNRQGKVPVTGQDASVEGLQNILEGTQCMTIQKSAKGQAGALAETAIAMVKGGKPNTTGTVKDSTGNRDVPAILLDPVAIDKANVKAVIDAGDLAAADLCKGTSPNGKKYADLCTEAGIS